MADLNCEAHPELSPYKKKLAVVAVMHWPESERGKKLGGAGNERGLNGGQIETPSRGAGAIEDSRAHQASRSSAFARTSIEGPPVGGHKHRFAGTAK